ncbi:MAG TPA: hypothetical protein VJ964_08990 [Balneolaceae bacterium]|nr:hypothetical protein [Balneolaceae bacterium]
MPTLDSVQKQLNDIQKSIDKNSKEARQQINEVRSNNDFTNAAKQQKIQELERARDKTYSELMDKKKSIVTEANTKLEKRLYSGKNTNPIAFDNAVNTFKNESEKELKNRLKQDPSSETKRAIYKASLVSKNPKFEVLAEASDLYPNDAGAISDYFEFQQQYGKLEDRTSKLERRLFGDTASA